MDGASSWLTTKANKVKQRWNNISESKRNIILTTIAIIFGSGKFFKDIGKKMFFLTKLFRPRFGNSRAGVAGNDILAISIVLGICYTNYLTAYLSLRYKIFKNFKKLNIDTPELIDENSPLLVNRSTNNAEVNTLVNDRAISDIIKDRVFLATLHIIAATRLIFVVFDTYLGVNKLYKDSAKLANKNINPKLLTDLTNTTGTYFALSDGLMYCAYAYRVILSNGNEMRESFTIDNIKQSNKLKLIFAALFSSLGILTKGIKDSFEISKALAFVPLIKRIPKQDLTYIGYFGGASSIAAKSIFEGVELGKLIYQPQEYLADAKQEIDKSKLTYLKLFAFFLNSLAEAAGGYLALIWLFNKLSITDKLEETGHLKEVQIPCAILVAVSVAALEFAFNVRCLGDNARHDAELEGLNEGIENLSINEPHEIGQQTDNLLFAYDAMNRKQNNFPTLPQPSLG